MPSARSASATSGARPRAAAGPHRLARRPPHARVRWDRVGRVALLVVLGVVGLLYVQHALSYLSARAQFNAQGTIVRRLERDNARLAQEQRALRDPATIVLDARKLGMVRPGERSYVITGQ
jgi:cell division protein FtsB